MQNLQDIQEKIFFESKSILETLSKINSKEELLAKQDLFAEITDRIAFLRILEKNKELLIQPSPAPEIQHQEMEITSDRAALHQEIDVDAALFEEDTIEEEVIFTNELNEIESIEQPEEVVPEEETPPIHAEITEEIQQPEEPTNYEERVAEKEKEFLEMEERRRKIVDFNKEDLKNPVTEVHQEVKMEQHSQEKKFKLAHIKGLKAVQNLFDQDPLEDLEEKSAEHKPENIVSGSIAKSNIPTDFMEAEKRKPEFRLDLNDRVAFTKYLFNGDPDELKKTIDQLNSYNNLEDAKQYLSDVYYSKNWTKVDEYAQRLWGLVENKFI
ncbi:hypothetical protein [Kaistella montana]|uniref:Uncharacterized protein n=1 Tax=Kaistella montana TaxID=1849733 RepID=A0ABW5KC50_9FLAO|nr:hypothetical protein [Kaistella montana]MCQ4035831.1 hypothetical protein [Kaistella montana]